MPSFGNMRSWGGPRIPGARTRPRPALTAATALLLTVAVQAQPAEVARYDVDQGLPQSMVNHILQDRDGFLWFGTGDGLARFDGTRFTVYKHDGRDSASLSHNAIWGLAEADAHHLWVGTRTGLDRLDRRTGRFQHVRSGLPRPVDGCWRVVQAQDPNALFYSPLSSTILQVGPKGVQHHPCAHFPSYCLRPAEDGGVYLLLSPDSLIHLAADGTTMEVRRIDASDAGKITDMLPLDDGWLMLAERATFRVARDGTRRTMPEDTRSFFAQHPGEHYLERAADGRIWVACSGVGAVMLRPDLTIEGIRPLLPPGTSAFSARAVYCDRQGNIWIGSDGQGVFRIAPQRIKFGRCMPGMGLPWEPPSWFVRGFAQWDAHHILVSFHKGGLALFDERSGILSAFTPPGIDVGDHVRPMNSADGLIWLTDERGIKALDPRTGRVVTHPALSRGGLLALDADGKALLVGSDSVYRFSFSDGRITASAEVLDPGIGRRMRRTERLYIDARGQWWTYGVLDPIGVTDGRNQLAIAAPHPGEDVRMTGLWPAGHDSAWMTTNEGLFLWALPERRVLARYTVHEGLPDQYTYCMLPGGDGTWWVSTNNGMARFRPATGTFEHHGVGHGAQSREFNSGAALRSTGGRLYFGGVSGFNHFDPALVRPDPDTAGIAVVALRSQGRDLPLAHGPITLPFHRNDLEVDLAVLEFTAPEHNRYTFLLDGYDSTWQVHPAARPITYKNLPDGRYRLLVRGINGDGLEGPVRPLLTVTVHLPFWASAWAVVLGTLAGAALVGLVAFTIYRARVRRRLERTEREMGELRLRTRLAQDLHDDVGSGLARIAALAGRAVQQRTAGATDEDPVRRVGAISRELMENLRDVVWMNEPGNGDLASLLLRIRAYAGDLFEGTATGVAFQFPEPLPERPIGGAFKRNAFLVAKEALLNAHRHAAARHVIVRFVLTDDGCRLEVCDDGVGAPVPSSGTGRGLRNLRARAEEAGCMLTFVQCPGEGTTVTLTCPSGAMEP